jgi:dTDP-4-dehydrorhamnose 3,5-epimerase
MGEWQPTSVPGLVRRQLGPIGDLRGSFMELWRAAWTNPFATTLQQANLSRSRAGVLRGMHFHDRQDDLWIVVEGGAYVVLVDLRTAMDSADAATPVEAFEMSPGAAVYIPRGVAHGFLAIEPLALLYLVTREYDGTDEHGFAWNDPALGLIWPIANPIVSPRDASNPSLADAVAAARQRGGLATAR